MVTKINGIDIAYKISGPEDAKETAVMLQGWGTDMTLYDSVADAVSDTFRVVQFDLPGFGSSEEPPEAWNVEAYCGFFCDFMDSLGIKKTALIGHSYGGRVIIKLAARESLPFEIDRIVLIDSAGIMPKRSFSYKLKVRRYKILKKILNTKLVYDLFPELINDWRSRQGSADYRNASPVMRACLVMAVNEDLTELLPKVRQDTLLIWGSLDPDTPLADAKVMEEKIPSSGLAVIEGAGHFSFLEKPLVFRSIMQSYFQIGQV